MRRPARGNGLEAACAEIVAMGPCVKPVLIGAATIALLLPTRVAAGEKFGYVLPKAQFALMQPAMDRYADTLRGSLASMGSLEFVSLRGGRGTENPDTCRKYGIAGFFQPNRRWRFDGDSIEVHVTLTVIGCDGSIFYYANVKREFERDATQEPQQQIDAATAEATAALAANFQAFRRAHAAEWKKLLTNAATAPSSQST